MLQLSIVNMFMMAFRICRLTLVHVCASIRVVSVMLVASVVHVQVLVMMDVLTDCEESSECAITLLVSSALALVLNSLVLNSHVDTTTVTRVMAKYGFVVR